MKIVNGYEIKPYADLSYADLRDAKVAEPLFTFKSNRKESVK